MTFVRKTERTSAKIVVSTGVENLPARNLYRSLGFRETEEAVVAPALRLTYFEKKL